MVIHQTAFPEVIIVVVTHNSAVDIEHCIYSLGAHFALLEQDCAEVHVVDNASSDETPAILGRLASEFNWLKLHLLGVNVGFGVGNNLVLNSFPAGAYILINADAWLIADSLTMALKHMAENPKTGIVGLPLVYPDGNSQSYAFVESAWHRWLLLLIGLGVLAKCLVRFTPIRTLMKVLPFSRNYVNNHRRPKLDLDSVAAVQSMATGEVRSAEWVSGAGMVLSRKFVEASRGFDPDIFLYGEDEDICIRCRKLGFSVESVQTAPIVHKHGWCGGCEFRPHVANMKYDSLNYFIAKNVHSTFKRVMMRLLLPAYVYGWNLKFFFERKLSTEGFVETVATCISRLTICHDAVEVEAVIKALRDSSGIRMVSFLNLNAISLSQNNRPFKGLLLASDYLFRDGVGVEIIMKQVLQKPGLNMNGTDFIPRILAAFGPETSLALFGSRDQALSGAAAILRDQGFAAIEQLDGFQDVQSYVDALRSSKAQLVVLGMGMPKQELVARAIAAEPAFVGRDLIIINGGAIIDFVSGQITRAPVWMRKFKLEWLYRVSKEPTRLCWRLMAALSTLIMVYFHSEGIRRVIEKNIKKDQNVEAFGNSNDRS